MHCIIQERVALALHQTDAAQPRDPVVSYFVKNDSLGSGIAIKVNLIHKNLLNDENWYLILYYIIIEIKSRVFVDLRA